MNEERLIIKQIFITTELKRFLKLLEKMEREIFFIEEIEELSPEIWDIQVFRFEMDTDGVQDMKELIKSNVDAFNITNSDDDAFSGLTINKKYSQILIGLLDYYNKGNIEIEPMEYFNPEDYESYNND